MEDKLVPTAAKFLIPNKDRKGFEEETSREDIIIPRAKLLQALSPEVIENAKQFQPGLIINSLTKEILPIEFIPVFKSTNWVRFNPRKKDAPGYDPAYGPGDIIWRSNDPLDPKVQAEGSFGANGEAPLATKFINFFCYFSGVNMPLILSFSKTSLKAGRRLLSLAQFSCKDMFATKYKLSAKQEVGDAGTYFVLAVDPVGAVSEEELAAGAWLWEQYHTKTIQVHDEAPEETTQQ